jgi:hypothetical protein
MEADHPTTGKTGAVVQLIFTVRIEENARQRTGPQQRQTRAHGKEMFHGNGGRQRTAMDHA